MIRLLAAWLLLSAASGALAQVRALVVGIDAYRHYPKLQGAVNDAQRVAEALRKAGVRDVRLLLNGDANRQAIETSWRALTGASAPGDTIIFTYAGHGAQEPEVVSGQEADGLDEVLVLGDFQNRAPGSGERIRDDDINRWFGAAADLNIVFVADACHSGTLTRSMDQRITALPSRTIGFYDLDPVDDVLPPVPQAATGEAGELANVTFLSAAREDAKVPEIRIGGLPHGALSWYFARSLEGAADNDGDGQLTVNELERFVIENVRIASEGRQQPELRSGLDHGAALLPSGTPAAPDVQMTDVAVHLLGGTPAQRKRIEAALGVEDGNAGTRLTIDLDRGDVLNALGDVVASERRVDAEFVRHVVDKYRVLALVTDAAGKRPLRLRQEPGDALHRRGDRLRFLASGRERPHLVVFNLAADGTLQRLFPVGSERSDSRKGDFAFLTEVTPPFGADHVVALATSSPPDRLLSALVRVDNTFVDAQFLSVLRATLATARPQTGVLGIFTGDSP